MVGHCRGGWWMGRALVAHAWAFGQRHRPSRDGRFGYLNWHRDIGRCRARRSPGAHASAIQQIAIRVLLVDLAVWIASHSRDRIALSLQPRAPSAALHGMDERVSVLAGLSDVRALAELPGNETSDVGRRSIDRDDLLARAHVVHPGALWGFQLVAKPRNSPPWVCARLATRVAEVAASHSRVAFVVLFPFCLSQWNAARAYVLSGT